jgi:hypothetical protein
MQLAVTFPGDDLVQLFAAQVAAPAYELTRFGFGFIGPSVRVVHVDFQSPE